MITEGKEVIISENKANVVSGIAFVVSVMIYGGGYGVLWEFGNVFAEFKRFLTDYVTLILTLIVGMVMHELLHGLTWAYFCRGGLRSIRYGIKWQALAPYAHCIEPLSIGAYRLGGAMPFIVLGMIPAVAGIDLENGWALVTGSFFTAGAAGDLMIIWKLRNYGHDTWIQDHPDNIGFIVVPKP